MPARNGAVHVATTKRVYKGKTYVTHLLRRSIRKGKTVTHETRGTLSPLPDHLLEIIKRSLQGETFVPAAEAFRITRSLPHGHVDAVLTMIRKRGVEDLIASEPSRRRDLVIAMIAECLLFPSSKLANTRHWHDTTLAEELGVGDATEDQLYDAMDWPLTRQEAIEKKLARKHLGDSALRRHQQLLRGEDLPAGPLRPRPRRQDRLPDPRLRRVDRRRRPARRRAGLSRQHRRPHDRPRPGRGAHEAVRPVAGGAGRRSWHAHTNSDRRAQEAPGPGLDLGVAQRRDPPPVGRRLLDPEGSGGRTPGGDHRPGIPRRAPGGLLQPPVGRAASAQAPGIARGHGGRTGGTGRARGAADGSARDGGRDRREGGQNHQPLQDGQTFHPDDS